MKALTFKKSALVAALLTAATTANAADTVTFGTLTNTGAINAGGYDLTARENGLKDKLTVEDGSALQAIRFVTDRALSANDKITFKFTNGGVPTNGTPKLMFATTQVDGDTGNNKDLVLKNLPSILFDTDDEGGIFNTITFRLNSLSGFTSGSSAGDVAGPGKNAVIYLVSDADENAVTTAGSGAGSVENNIAISSGDGIKLAMPQGVAAGQALSVDVTVDYAESGVADYSAGSANLSRSYSAIALEFDSSVKTEASVDFGNEMKTFVKSGSLVSTKSVTSGSITLKEVSELKESSVDWNNDGTVSNTVTAKTSGSGVLLFDEDAVDFSDANVSVSVKLDNCAAVEKEDASVVLAGATTALSYDEDETCLWTGAINPAADVTSDSGSIVSNVKVLVDGETELQANEVDFIYDYKFDGVSVAANSKTVQEWTTDVLTNGVSKFFPSLLAVNNSDTTFSVVRFDNTKQTKATDIVIKGSVQNINTGEVTTFENVYLGQIAAKSQHTIVSDMIIDALVDPKDVPADFGYMETAVEGVAKENAYYISVTMEPAKSQGGSFGPIEAYQAAPTGRTAINVGGQ